MTVKDDCRSVSATPLVGDTAAGHESERARERETLGTPTPEVAGYSFVVTGGKKLEITPRQGITEKCVAHAINHTFQSDFEMQSRCKLRDRLPVSSWV